MLNVRAPWILSERLYFWIAIGIVCFGLSLRLIGLDKGMWIDEYSSLRKVSVNNFLYQLRTDTHPPLYIILLKLWSFISTKEEFLRFFSVLFGIGTLVVVMKWIKQYSLLGSLLAGLYCATLPKMLQYSQEIRNYSLFLFFTALSFLFASYIISKPEKLSGYIGLAFCLSAAVATHLLGMVLLMSIFVYVVLVPSTLNKLKIKRTLLAFVIPFCMFLFFYYFFLQKIKENTANWWMPQISLERILSIENKVIGLDTIARYFSMILPRSIYGITGFITSGLVFSLFVFADLKYSLPLCIAAIIFWSQILVYSIFATPIFWYKTILPGMVPFIGFIGLQIASIRIKKLKIFFIALFVLLCSLFTIDWIKSEAWKSQEQWPKIIHLLRSNWQPKDLIIFIPGKGEGLVKYYFNLPPEATLPVYRGTDIAEVKGKINEHIAKCKKKLEPFTVFLVVRLCLSLNNQVKEYHELLKYLEFSQPVLIERAGSLILTKYKIDPGV